MKKANRVLGCREKLLQKQICIRDTRVRRVHRNTVYDSGHPSAKQIISAWSRWRDKLPSRLPDSVYFPFFARGGDFFVHLA